MLKLFGREIDPLAPYVVYFSDEKRQLSPAAQKRWKTLMSSMGRLPYEVFVRMLSEVPIDEIPNTVDFNGLLLIDFIKDRRLCPLFGPDFKNKRELMVISTETRRKFKSYEQRLGDASGRQSRYFY